MKVCKICFKTLAAPERQEPQINDGSATESCSICGLPFSGCELTPQTVRDAAEKITRLYSICGQMMDSGAITPRHKSEIEFFASVGFKRVSPNALGFLLPSGQTAKIVFESRFDCDDYLKLLWGACESKN